MPSSTTAPMLVASTLGSHFSSTRTSRLEFGVGLHARLSRQLRSGSSSSEALGWPLRPAGSVDSPPPLQGGYPSALRPGDGIVAEAKGRDLEGVGGAARTSEVPDVTREPRPVVTNCRGVRAEVTSCLRDVRGRAARGAAPGNEGRVRCRARPSGQGYRLLPPPRSAGVRTTGHSPGGSVRESSFRARPPAAAPRRAGRGPQGPRGPTPRRRRPWRTPTAARRTCGRPRGAAARPGPAGRRLTSAMPGRRIGPEILAQLAQTFRVVAAGGQQGGRVEQARAVPGIRQGRPGRRRPATTRSMAANSSAARTGFER